MEIINDTDSIAAVKIMEKAIDILREQHRFVIDMGFNADTLTYDGYIGRTNGDSGFVRIFINGDAMKIRVRGYDGCDYLEVIEAEVETVEQVAGAIKSAVNSFRYGTAK